MRIAFICHIFDETHPINAALVRWVKVLADKPQVEQVVVIPLDEGEHPYIKRFRPHIDLPSRYGSKVFVNPPIRGRNRLKTIINFYMDAWFWSTKRFARGYKPAPIDCFFLWGGGVYPVLLLPFRFLFKKPVYHWKAHQHISPMQRLYVRLCDTKVFTSTPTALPIRKRNKIKVVGQGIDITHFRPMPEVEKTGDLITVGRVTPSKRIHVMLDALKWCNRQYGSNYTLDVYGPIGMLRDDREYFKRLKRQVQDYRMENAVRFHGPVLRKDLPKILNRHKAYLNLSYGQCALDRACVEAMACGLPVVSSNPCVAEILPEALRDMCVAPPYVLNVQAQQICRWMGSYVLRDTMGEAFRHMALQHSDETLWDKILDEITKS